MLIDRYKHYCNYITYSSDDELSLDDLNDLSTLSAIIAYFGYLKLGLSVELLIHSIFNHDYDSIYEPIKKDVVTKGSISKEIADNRSLIFGDDEFDNLSRIIDKDLYYAIKRFEFVKEYIDEDNILLHIRDRYDFEKSTEANDNDFDIGYFDDLDSEDIHQYAINLMADYQEKGFLTPFIVDIKVSMPGKVDYSYEIVDNKAVINYISNDTETLLIPNEVSNIYLYTTIGCNIKVNVSKIESNVAKNHLNLKSITLPEGVCVIGNHSFENCYNLNYIYIPNTVVEIGDSAFNNCTSLISISLSKNVINIGNGAFDNCSSLTKIYVDISRIFRYLSTPHLAVYKTLFDACSNDNMLEYNLHCRIAEIDVERYLESNDTLFFKLNIECQIKYDINAYSENDFKIVIYNNDFSLVEISNTFEISTSKYYSYMSPVLDVGEYNVGIFNTSLEDSGTVNYFVKPNTKTVNNIANDEEVNVLTHLHNNTNEFIFVPSQSGIFLLELFAIVDGNNVNSFGKIQIYDSKNNLLKQSIENSNSVMLYEEKYDYYIVYLEVSDLEYDELTLKISSFEDFTILNMNEDDEYVNTSNIKLGDFAYIYNLERIGTYNIKFEYQGTQTDNMIFALYESNEDGKYSLKNSYEINNVDNIISFEDSITNSKRLLLCVFNSKGLGKISVDIRKEINDEFTIYGASNKNESTITLTKGLQEICYLGVDAPNTTSRYTYYNWYSTNNNVIVVSAYGTVTAVGVGEAQVKCVYKIDPSKTATLTFNIIDDPLNNGEEENIVYLSYGFDVRLGEINAGTEVTSGKGSVILVSNNPSVTIHLLNTRYICLGTDSPNSSVQTFNWTVYREEGNTGMVSVSQYGTITGTNVGWVTVEGTYKYNSRYKVKFRIYVESNN